MVYSLWLCPITSSSIATSLVSTIVSLGCSFNPHITLTTKIPFYLPIEEINSSLVDYFSTHDKPYVRIDSLDTGPEFYKRIFLRCEKTDSLLALARFSKETFANFGENIDDWVDEYDPHISLIYAEKQNCDDEQLINRINKPAIIGQTWQGGTIKLVDTSKKLTEWKTVLEFDISSPM